MLNIKASEVAPLVEGSADISEEWPEGGFDETTPGFLPQKRKKRPP